MPRRPRIDFPGYHHIINSGVNRSTILSRMKINKKTKRSGHLWQGRFYSRYINGEEYYYALVRYIEQNPLEAGIANKVGEYPYTLGSVIANKNTPMPCTLKSKLIEELSYENIQDMIGVKLDAKSMELLEEVDKQKVLIKDGKNSAAYSKDLKEHFEEAGVRAKRDNAIVAAVEDGYTQAEIAKYLKMSRSNVCKIIKSVYLPKGMPVVQRQTLNQTLNPTISIFGNLGTNKFSSVTLQFTTNIIPHSKITTQKYLIY